MRIDKYLWAIRYFKTRSKATDAIKKGHVRINNSVVKPSREVYPSDTIRLRYNQIDYIIEVIDLPHSRVGNKLVDLYRIDRTPLEHIEQRKLIAQNQDYYRRKGEGRPTKKDRRDLDDLFDDIKEEE